MFHLLLAVIYLAFISLGLPDALLGSAWPSMYPVFHVPVSYAGIISMIIAAGTVISSLQNDRLTKKLGTGKITAISVATTAVALIGFSVSHSFIALCLWAVPYGLGGGSVDAALNNYVALHYESRHMSWLHCMWGVGASIGPYIMGYALSNKQGWSMGYRYISIFQIGLTAILIISLPLWKQFQNKGNTGQPDSSSVCTLPALTLKQIFQIPGAREILFAFFCYSAIEQTSSLWASSYLVLHLGYSSEKAAGFASLFFIGITVGRGISGFITFKLNDSQMIHLGEGIILIGVLAMIFPFGKKNCFNRTYPHRTWMCTDLPIHYSLNPRTFWCGQISVDYWSTNGVCLYWNLSDASIFWHYCKIHRCYTLSDLSGSLFMHHVLYV